MLIIPYVFFDFDAKRGSGCPRLPGRKVYLKKLRARFRSILVGVAPAFFRLLAVFHSVFAILSEPSGICFVAGEQKVSPGCSWEGTTKIR